MPKMYRKKPVVIEAIRIGDDTVKELAEFDGVLPMHLGDMFAGVRVDTLEGRMHGNKGDYLIRGVMGEVYPCRADIFEQTCEEV